MHIHFDEQSSPEHSPIEQKIPESHSNKNEKNGPKALGDYVPVIGIVRDVSEDEDLENVTVGGYAVVWKNNVFPVQSGSYAGEANVNFFMELAATKAILEVSPTNQPLYIGAKDSQLVTFINSRKAPLKKRKRIVGPLMDEVRALLQKRTAKTQAIRAGPIGSDGIEETRQLAIKIAAEAQQERMKLRPVELEAILPKSTKQQETSQSPKQEAHDASTDAPALQQTQVTHEKDAKLAEPEVDQKPSPPVENVPSSTKEEPIRGKENYGNNQVPEATTTMESVEAVTENNVQPIHEEPVVIEKAEDTPRSNGYKRSRTEDEDEILEEGSSNTYKKAKVAEESLSRSMDHESTQQQQNDDNNNQTGWLSWMKNIFGIKK
ncbi:hypothetical protein BDA99DRAFT_510577 [Phascolomyces articulosus]|uniref:Uncharacterized protein n=1 Tax=Phascolomyces articulosus TaxID=60185 RepID=A0AAD5JZH3_9FUNG|nr:hypothetical protein BDA99DRAFT_510577 [Phascolomyces articulosus]